MRRWAVVRRTGHAGDDSANSKVDYNSCLRIINPEAPLFMAEYLGLDIRNEPGQALRDSPKQSRQVACFFFGGIPEILPSSAGAPSMRPALASVARRALLLHALPFATLYWPSRGTALTTDPLFERLRNRYILLRPGETTFEAAGMVDSNPINKGNSDRGLTSRGREQVRRSVEALQARGVDTGVTVFYDNGARATQVRTKLL